MTTNKINFSALKNNNSELNKDIEEKKSPPKEIKVEEVVEKINENKNKPLIQVSLGKKKDIILTEVKNEEKKEITEEKISPPKETKIDLKTINEIQKGDETLIKEGENLFNNYESDFSSKQDSIIDKLKKLKDLPKTRPALVYGMLTLLIFGVSGLVFISPNDSYLKASVLGVEQEKVIPVQDNLSEIAKKKALELKIKTEKEKSDKEKQNKLENFLLNKNKKTDKLPKNNTDIKNKGKNKKLKDLLLEARRNK